MKNIIVTGGSGFIGSNVVNALLEKKFKVIILDKTRPKIKNIKYIYSDLSNLNSLKKITKNVDYIFHFAGVSDINKVKLMPVKTIKDNVLITTNLLEAAKINKIKRFIFASSIYTHSSKGNLYTTSKLSAENIIKDYNKLFKIKYTILRYATVYGTNNRGADVISLFTERAKKNKNIYVHNNGKQTRDFIHAKDLANCTVKILKKNYENKTLTIGNKKKVKILYIANLIKRLTNSKSKIIIDKKRKRFDDFDLNGIKSIQKKSYLKYKKRHSLIAGIKNFLREN